MADAKTPANPNRSMIGTARGPKGIMRGQVATVDPQQVNARDAATQDGRQPGVVRRFLDLLGVYFGPGNPPIPQAPEEEKPRVFDYPPFLNTWRLPETIKSQETGGFTFAQLRSLSEQTVVNGAIFHAIDKIKKIEWTFTVLPKPGEDASVTQQRAHTDPRITEIRTFFESPDKERDFPEWIADAWLQILTCDNLSLYNWPYATKMSPAGPYAIDVLDGDHIQPLIDDTGRVPRDPDTEAYVQWTKGQPRKAFTRRQMMYAMCWPSAQRVMGRSPIERMWFYLDVAVRRDLSKMAWYTDGNIPAGLWPVDVSSAGWTPEQLASVQANLDLIAAGDPKARSKIVLVPAGQGKPIFPAEKSLLDPFDDFLARLACFFIGIPVGALIKEVNRSVGEENREQADEEGELPRTHFTRRLLNRLIRTWWGYDDVIALPKRDVEIDAAKQSEIDDRGIKNGSKQIDEVRKRNGDEPLGLPPGMVTVNGFATFDAMLAGNATKAAGGDNQDDNDNSNSGGGETGDDETSKSQKKKSRSASRTSTHTRLRY